EVLFGAERVSVVVLGLDVAVNGSGNHGRLLAVCGLIVALGRRTGWFLSGAGFRGGRGCFGVRSNLSTDSLNGLTDGGSSVVAPLILREPRDEREEAFRDEKAW